MPPPTAIRTDAHSFRAPRTILGPGESEKLGFYIPPNARPGLYRAVTSGAYREWVDLQYGHATGAQREHDAVRLNAAYPR